MPKIKLDINWMAISLAYISLFALGLLDSARSPFYLDISTELKLSDTKASLFFVATSIVSFMSGFFVPRISQAMGLLNTLRLGLLILSTGFAATSFAHQLSSLLLGCAFFGIGFGIINVAQNLLILEGSQGEWRRRLLSGLHGMYAISALVAPVVAAYFFRAQWSWRLAFVGLSSAGLFGFIFSLFVKNVKNAKNSSVDLLLSEPARQSHIKKEYLIVSLMISFYIVAEVLISTRLPLLLRRAFDYTPEESAYGLTLFFIFLLIGRSLFLFIKFHHTNLKIIEWSLVASLLFFTLGVYAHPLLLTVCGFTMAPIFGLTVDYTAQRFHQSAHKAVSICVTMSGIFLVIMHFTIGYLTEIIGIDKAMSLGVFALLVSWLILQQVKKMDRSTVESRVSHAV